jgi:tetratricopeptide (TPR) repeat protein
MKKYNIILSTLAMLFLWSGCYDLNRYPYDKVSSGTFWQTESQAKSGLMGVYNDLKNENSFGLTFGLDNIGEIGQGYDPPGFNYVFLGTYTPATSQVLSKWQSLYDGVMRANTVIQNVPKVNMSDELKTAYIAEAKFLRALYYFSLTDFFGAIPLYDETTVLDKDFNNMKNPRSSIDEVRAFILADLDAAIASLPVQWDNANYGRATKGAAYALKGKVLLYAKKYAEAITCFEEIVKDPSGRGYGYALYSSYADLFKPTGDQSSEMIFAIQNSGGTGMSYGMPMTFYMGTRSSFGSCWDNVMLSTSFVDSYEYKDGRPFNWNDIIPGFNESTEVKGNTFRATLSGDFKTVAAYPESKGKLLDMYEKRDPRMTATVILPYTIYKGWVSNAPRDCEYVIATGVNEANGFIRVNNGWECYLYRKFVSEGNMNNGITDRAHTPINFPLIRYADVLLMLAECYNEAGRQSDAVTLINQVRARVNMPGINSGPAWLAANSKDEVFKRIRHERVIELAGEGLNYSDLRRWGLYLTLKDKVEYGFTGKRQFTRVVTDRDYLWPVPSTEIDKNPNLKPNNPGWE